MPAEGMVHALHRAATLVAPGGLLIDLHPTADDAQLSVVGADGLEESIGPLPSQNARERHANADAAIVTAITDGTLTRKAASVFAFSRYCDSVDELVAHVHSKWTARFDEKTIKTARSLLRPGTSLRLRELVAITALQPVTAAVPPT